jgi:hypothetical protein
MAPDPEVDVPVPGAPPGEEKQVVDEGHVVGRRRPDGRPIDEVGDPVPLDRNPHHGA